MKGKKTQEKKVNPKEIAKYLLAHEFPRISSREDWYFDSSFSQHINGEKGYI